MLILITKVFREDLWVTYNVRWLYPTLRRVKALASKRMWSNFTPIDSSNLINFCSKQVRVMNENKDSNQLEQTDYLIVFNISVPVTDNYHTDK